MSPHHKTGDYFGSPGRRTKWLNLNGYILWLFASQRRDRLSDTLVDSYLIDFHIENSDRLPHIFYGSYLAFQLSGFGGVEYLVNVASYLFDRSKATVTYFISIICK